MREAPIGRVLVASLHQSIADLLPTRLGFYENWLNPRGLREGTIGLAPLYAVLSFLRQEGEVYGLIVRRAGEYAADWTVESMPPFERSFLRSMPVWLRGRLLVRAGRKLVRDSYLGSHVKSRLRRGTARVDLRASVFCTVREPVGYPLCGFYAAAFEKMLAAFSLRSRAEVLHCRGTGDPTCILRIVLAAASTGEEPEVEAA